MSFDGEREAVGDDDEALAVLFGSHFAGYDAIEGFGWWFGDDIDMESTAQLLRGVCLAVDCPNMSILSRLSW